MVFLLSSSQALTWDLFYREDVKRILSEPSDAPISRQEEESCARRSLAHLQWWVSRLSDRSASFIANVSIFNLVYIVIIAQMALAGCAFNSWRLQSTASSS